MDPNIIPAQPVVQPTPRKKLPQWLTTVTLFSKLLAMVLFIFLPLLGFYLGIQYQQKISITTPVVSEVQNNPTAIPTPILTATPTSTTPSTIGLSNWKTYACAFKGVDNFSVKYPPTWYVIQPTQCSQEYSNLHEEFHLGSSMNQGGEQAPINFHGIDIMFEANGEAFDNNQVITPLTTALEILKTHCSPFIKINTRQIGSKTAYQGECGDVRSSSGNKFITGWVIRIPSGIVEFLSLYTDNNGGSIQDSQEFESILNTVQF